MRMAVAAPTPSLREASCCRVEVMKGGGGLRRTWRRSIEATEKARRSISRLACSARSWLSRSNLSSLRPSRWVRRAFSVCFLAVPNSTSTVQYSRLLKTSISASRSQIRRSATDCTRPAERLPGSLRHSTGERVKPTR